MGVTAGADHLAEFAVEGGEIGQFLLRRQQIQIPLRIPDVRARRRSLTDISRRRMTYLLSVFLAPAWGIFPYSVLGQWSNERRLVSVLVR